MIYERGVAGSRATGTPTPSLDSLFNHIDEYTETRAGGKATSLDRYLRNLQ